MKNIFSTLTLLVLLSYITYASDVQKNKGSIAFTFSGIESNFVINRAQSTLEGEASKEGKGFYTLGISYLRPIKKWLDFETGIDYSNHTIEVDPMDIPDWLNRVDYSAYDKTTLLINVPVSARVNFLKYFFVNGGLLFEIDISTNSPIGNQSGIGTVQGLGAEFRLYKGLGIFANAYTKFHSLVPFADQPNEHRWRLFEGSLRFGLSYSF